MVLVSHRYKFIFVKETNVAGTSLEAFLSQFCCDPEYAEKTDLFSKTAREHHSAEGIIGSRNHSKENPKKIWYNHLSLQQIAEKIKKQGLDVNDYLVVLAVRNPWNNTVSHYLSLYRKNVDFSSYVKKFANRKPEKSVKRILLDNNIKVDYFIRFEHLEEDIQKLLDKLNIKLKFDISMLPKHRTDKAKHPNKTELLANYRSFYNDETRNIVAKAYQPYIEKFGYQFHP